MEAQDFRTTPPPLSPLKGAELPDVQSFKLANGIRVVAYKGDTQPINMVSLVRPGGNADLDSPALLSMMLATMAEGTTSRSGAELADAFDSNGSWLNSGAYGHHSVVSLMSLNSRIADVLPAFVDLMENASFPSRELEAKKMQIAQQIGVQKQKVSTMADWTMRKLMFGSAHPLATLNSPERVMEVDRAALSALFAATRHPASTYLFVGGSLTAPVLDAICKAMEQLQPSSLPPVERRLVPPVPSAPGVERIAMPDSLQSAVCAGIPVVNRHHPDYPMLHLVVTALGGYFGSRLMMNLREDKGYTYGVSSSLMGVHEGAWVKIAFECSHDYVDSAIDQVRAELHRLAVEPPQGEELERLRRFALVSHLETLDSPLEIVSFYRNMVLSDIPNNYFTAKQRAILSVTPSDISRIASTYLNPDTLRIAIAGR